MSDYFSLHQDKIINAAIVLVVFFILQLITGLIVRAIGKSKKILVSRAKIVARYFSVSLFLITLLIVAFIFGIKIEDLVVVFSSVFAVIGLALFASWSILSNVTSGIILFFSFPYKIGDKIKIHDKEFEIEAIIEDIRSFQIHLRRDNGDLVTYPNSLLLQKAVTIIEKDAFDK
ncbi:mechanosensitive ion channel domain-containing protein [Flavivirga spongiicola]|uniref:Mechanosensitive ion channel family protein n=1 Tax=Flavivirga spongiicola TaxID=421621 RepID=A0ABU7XNX0_9FLAO|nr:mechanosensitive ion channel domain-containing protein [Flavivirga sp. MEBiC05379]MDO5981885.1 mechanosensitive ion channel [Flavivirga sp. MEBiC05379]